MHPQKKGRGNKAKGGGMERRHWERQREGERTNRRNQQIFL